MPGFPLPSAWPLRRSLRQALSWFGKVARQTASSADEKLLPTAGGCTGCGKCLAVCPFLKAYGTPKAIAENASDLRQLSGIAYRCSLCRLCNEICPEGFDLPAFFLDIRRAATDAGAVSWRPYLPMLFYEGVGRSRLFSLELLPPGCDTVFFPGCALPGAYPEETLALFDLLGQHTPRLGLILGCCGKLSHDLGRETVFTSHLRTFLSHLASRRVTTLITACPSCAELFRTSAPGLTVATVYQILADQSEPVPPSQERAVTVHDACALRCDSATHQAVRRLLSGLGYRIEEMDHSRQQTLCCGQGGMVTAIDRPLAAARTEKRLSESRNLQVVVYCAGCAASFAKATPTLHLAQLLTTSGQTTLPKPPAFPPFTYWNRLRLKWRLRAESKK